MYIIQFKYVFTTFESENIRNYKKIIKKLLYFSIKKYV